jgi:FAD/FMN-containing dehydrogenase
LTPDIPPAFLAEIDGIETITAPQILRQKSRDYSWFSPILARELDGKLADLVVVPCTEADVIRVAAACARHGVPLTVRGGGTGNFGQAVPLYGGVVLDTIGMNKLLWVRGASARMQGGCTLMELDEEIRAHGWELRIHPSTKRQSTIAGFIAGGAAGVGSITWGQIRDRGSILGVRIVTVEENPRTIELRGDDIAYVAHAYGTTGIITEVEVPLAPAWPWFEAIVAFDGIGPAARFAQAFGEAIPVIKKLDTLLPWPISQYLAPLKEYLPGGASAVFCIVAEPSLEPFHALVKDHGGRITLERPEANLKVPLYEYTWNHTTLHALKADRNVTVLWTSFPVGRNIELIERLHAIFGDEVMLHCEFQRRPGGITCTGAPLVKFTSDQRLFEILRIHEEHGVVVGNTHTYHLHDKSDKVVSVKGQAQFRRTTDPLGLLNPGKMTDCPLPARVAARLQAAR